MSRGSVEHSASTGKVTRCQPLALLNHPGDVLGAMQGRTTVRWYLPSRAAWLGPLPACGAKGLGVWWPQGQCWQPILRKDRRPGISRLWAGDGLSASRQKHADKLPCLSHHTSQVLSFSPSGNGQQMKSQVPPETPVDRLVYNLSTRSGGSWRLLAKRTQSQVQNTVPSPSVIPSTDGHGQYFKELLTVCQEPGDSKAVVPRGSGLRCFRGSGEGQGGKLRQLASQVLKLGAEGLQGRGGGGGGAGPCCSWGKSLPIWASISPFANSERQTR